MGYPEDLLEQARHLAKRERNRPKQASLRRAVSSAYYALFHLLIADAVKNWKRPRERFTLARMFEHETMRRVCAKKQEELRRLNNRIPRPAPGPDTERNRHLLTVAEVFISMLEERHTADYDGSEAWSRLYVLERIGAVERAFASWKTIRSQPEAQNFLVTLLLKTKA